MAVTTTLTASLCPQLSVKSTIVGSLATSGNRLRDRRHVHASRGRQAAGCAEAWRFVPSPCERSSRREEWRKRGEGPRRIHRRKRQAARIACAVNECRASRNKGTPFALTTRSTG